MHSKQDKKPNLLWLQGVTCNANTHSFLNLPYLGLLLSKFNIIYHPSLDSLKTLEDVVLLQEACDILIFEGTFDPLMKRHDVLVQKVLLHYAKKAQNIIALGTCASFGGMFLSSAPQRNSGLVFKESESYGPLLEQESKVINLSGCPIHPEWLGSTLNLLASGFKILKDELHRPVELYSQLVHHGCTRNEYFEWKVDAKQFGLKEGCLFYDQGCRGPLTHASCNTILWSDVSSKTRVGTPCFGCTEPDFPRENLYETKTNMSIPQEVPLGISKRSYLTLTGIAKTFTIKRLEGKLIDYKTTD
jgi:hydrogenase small subunit